MLTTAPINGKSAFLLAFFWLVATTDLALAGDCKERVAQAVSVQGQLEVLTAGSANWQPASLGDSFCPGDRLRVGANSRAGLTLNDDTLIRLAEHSSLVISAPAEDGSAWLDLMEGIAHFISRVKHAFQVNTPYVNASIEGTEFTVESGQTLGRVIVMEGRVRAHNAQGEVIVNGGEQALARQGQAPWVETVVDPMDAVQWALYYPSVIDFSADQPMATGLTGKAREPLDRSIQAYRQGDLNSAFSALAEIPAVDQEADLLIYRASLHLQVGGSEAARKDLDRVIRTQPGDARALALMSILSTVRNERQTALNLAEQAVQSDPQLAASHLALSYAQQARFQLSDALAAAQQAVRVEANNTLAWSRLAQLHLMFRDMGEATEAARRAVEIDPNQPQTQSTLGYARLIELDLDGARQAFDQAISLDQAAPLPRLGLGLVLIRQGDLAAGRRMIETAADLDPGNALIRSYLGKAYYEEKRDKQAAAQFELAKQFDALDPTAWFYDAIRKQTENRPLEALDDLQTAIALNDNRAVYRSRLLLDDDQAARSASLARTYDDLGFERLALKESWKSLAADPGNASAHRFLSDAYAGVPRHEIARVSELMQAQMLAQEIVSPVSPSASEANLLAFQGSGPSLAGFNEYNPLFNRQRLSFLASGVTGSNNTRGEEIAVGGFTNRGMLSAGYYTERSDGFRENNDSDQTIKNVFGQFRITSELSVQGEVKHREGEYGDLAQLFEQDYFLSQLVRREIDSDSRRFGLNYTPSLRDTFLVSFISQDLSDIQTLPGNQIDKQDEGDQYEAQYIHKGDNNSITAGVSRVDSETTETLTLSFIGLPFPIVSTATTPLDQKSAYIYLNSSWSWGESVIGFDYTSLDNDDLISDKQFNPKLGLVWNLSDATIFRLAAFRTVRLNIIDNQTISPTEIAGFNQIYDDFLGSESDRYAFGVDHSFNSRLFGGLELSRRRVSRISDDLVLLDEEQREFAHKAYLYFPIDSSFSLLSQYTYEKNERDYIDGNSDPYRPAMLTTQAFELSGNYFSKSGLFAKISGTHIAQDIESILSTTGTASDSENFWISDATIGYRLPKRTGLVSLQVKNIFDKEFRYQSTFPGTSTPKSSPYIPERAFFLQAQLWF